MSKHSEREVLDESVKQSQQISRPSRTYWQDAWRMLRKNGDRLASVFFFIFFFLYLIAFCLFIPLTSSTYKNTVSNNH